MVCRDACGDQTHGTLGISSKDRPSGAAPKKINYQPADQSHG
jgi:hypothetical protein